MDLLFGSIVQKGKLAAIAFVSPTKALNKVPSTN